MSEEMIEGQVERVARAINPDIWRRFDERAERKGWTAEERSEELAARLSGTGLLAFSVKHARAAIAAYNPNERLREAWRSIKTAPKDETQIILTDGEYVSQDHWVRWPAGGESWDEFRYLEPTHWQPLPEPPALSPLPQGEDT